MIINDLYFAVKSHYITIHFPHGGHLNVDFRDEDGAYIPGFENFIDVTGSPEPEQIAEELSKLGYDVKIIP